MNYCNQKNIVYNNHDFRYPSQILPTADTLVECTLNLMVSFKHQDHGLIGGSQAQVAVVMVPFIAQGHINQLLHLSRLISAYNLPIHFITTTTHCHQAKLRIHGWDPLSVATIQFHQIKTPHFLSSPPNPNSSTKFPTHLQPSFDATLLLREPIAKLIQTISTTAKKIIVIYDFLMTFVVQDVVTLNNAEAYVFRPLSVFYTFWSIWERLGKPFGIEPEIQSHSPSIQGSSTPEFREFTKIQAIHDNFHSGILFDTSRVIEGKYVDLFSSEEIIGKTKLWAIGPFNPVEIPDSSNRHKCLEWLDNQEPSSVTYVSFGTTTSLSKEEIHELAIGLEESEQKFLWVLRDADRGDNFGEVNIRLELPKGYEERVKGKGKIIRSWAPQIEILGHPSTGGFISHCGWNSSMESLTAGVPMATWPMHSDQPWNAVLITKVLKVGLVMKNWDDRNELILSSSIEMVVRKLMNTQEGEAIRKRAKEMSEAIKRSVAEGGETHLELDSFIAHITR